MTLQEIPLAQLRDELIRRTPLSVFNTSELIEELEARGVTPKMGWKFKLPGSNLVYSNERITEASIIQSACSEYKEDFRKICSKTRGGAKTVECRAVCIYLLHLNGLDKNTICSIFSLKDRDTVQKWVKAIKEQVEKDSNFACRINHIKAGLLAK